MLLTEIVAVGMKAVHRAKALAELMCPNSSIAESCAKQTEMLNQHSNPKQARNIVLT